MKGQVQDSLIFIYDTWHYPVAKGRFVRNRERWASSLKHRGRIPIVLSLLSVFKPPASPTVPVTFLCSKLCYPALISVHALLTVALLLITSLESLTNILGLPSPVQGRIYTLFSQV